MIRNKDDETIEIFIDALPPTANSIWRQNHRTGQTYLNPQYKNFREITALTVGRGRMPQDWKYCSVSITIFPRRRIGDADNRIKATLDALTYARFWPDDKVVAEVIARFGKVDKNGAVSIVVTKRDRKFED